MSNKKAGNRSCQVCSDTGPLCLFFIIRQHCSKQISPQVLLPVKTPQKSKMQADLEHHLVMTDDYKSDIFIYFICTHRSVFILYIYTVFLCLVRLYRPFKITFYLKKPMKKACVTSLIIFLRGLQCGMIFSITQ